MQNTPVGTQPGFTVFGDGLKEYPECLSDWEPGHSLRTRYISLRAAGRAGRVTRVRR